MKTKRKLTIGREYYLDARKDVTGVLVKTDEDSAYFKCTSQYNGYLINSQGLLPLSISYSNQFKEVPVKAEEKYSNRKSCLIILLMTAVLWGGVIALILAL